MILFFNVIFVCLNTAVASVLICCLALLKMLLPVPALQRAITRACNGIMWVWATLNNRLVNLTSNVEWDIQGGESLSKEQWYLLIANHMSWADIVVVFSVFRHRIPMAKFFLKQQLLYVPFLGLACWAVDMPFMKRYSRQYLLKHPEKRGCDLKTTRKSCERFRHTPTTVVNFVEGTRFTEEKGMPPIPLIVIYCHLKRAVLLIRLGQWGSNLMPLLTSPWLTQKTEPFPLKTCYQGR